MLLCVAIGNYVVSLGHNISLYLKCRLMIWAQTGNYSFAMYHKIINQSANEMIHNVVKLSCFINKSIQVNCIHIGVVYTFS